MIKEAVTIQVSAKKLFLILMAMVLVGAGYLAYALLTHGFSAREEPSWAEKYFARHARRIATPAGAKELKNPHQVTPESMAEAKEHSVAHCSSCHGIDGRGDTIIGRNLYPKAPDMTDLETQRLSDGELYYIISNGVRFTGMPAWGSEDSPESIWALVAFIRRLPHLTPQEIQALQPSPTGEEKGDNRAPKGHTHAPGTAPHKH